ncbi:MAG: 23S rRNA (uracil(1939)-C(5))-methyltransferase RlmD [Candidatus Obscuribacterales bacterium]|nr:23S rRNA (uracil(1939)-C(5))-methyltransferase RlmD [Candidatus Obscuribacterales bacterium]
MVNERTHQLSRGQIVRLNIQSLAPGGDGVSRHEGIPVFVSRVAPEDVVEVQLVDVRKNFARGIVESVVEPSAQRQEPPCKIFKVCGGCQWQHISYDYQLKAKEDIVRQAIKHIGGLSPDLVQTAIGAQNNLHYRNKAQFPVRHPHDSTRILAGYYGQGSHKLINVKFCPVQPQALDEMLESVKAVCERHAMTAYDERSHKGLLRHILGRFSFANNKLLITLVLNSSVEHLRSSGFSEELLQSVQSFETSDEDEEGDPTSVEPKREKPRFGSAHGKKIIPGRLQPEMLERIAEDLMSELPQAVGVCINLNPDRGNRILGGTTICLAGESFITEELKSTRSDFPELLTRGIKFRLSPASFFQINTEQAGKLLEAVADALLEFGSKPKTLVDAYAGVGTMSIWLSPFAEKVIAIEEIEPAVEDGRTNLELNGVANVEFCLGTVEKMLPEVTERIHGNADVVLLDPPRKGCSPDALNAVFALNPKRIIYVSCNPATLARDLKIIEQNGYKTKRVQPVDMFPQTYHVESVTTIERQS